MGKLSKKIVQQRANRQQQVHSKTKAKYVVVAAFLVALGYVLVVALGR